MYHANPQPSFVGDIILEFKPSFFIMFHGFGVQGYGIYIYLHLFVCFFIVKSSVNIYIYNNGPMDAEDLGDKFGYKLAPHSRPFHLSDPPETLHPPDISPGPPINGLGDFRRFPHYPYHGNGDFLATWKT